MYHDRLGSGAVFAARGNAIFELRGIAAEDVVTNLVVWSPTLGSILETNQLAEITLVDLRAGTHSITSRASCANGRRYILPEFAIRVVHPNPTFASRPQFVGNSVELSVDTRGAAGDPGEFGESGSVWWSWTAPTSGLVVFEKVSNDLGDVNLALLEGNSLDSLQPVSGNRVSAGRVYAIRGLPFSGDRGRYRLTLFPGRPLNDAFADRGALVEAYYRETVFLDGATPEPGEPASEVGSDKPSIWYTFTAPANGTIEFGALNAVGKLFPLMFPGSLFHGVDLAGLQFIPSLDGSGLFAVRNGETYQLRLQHAFPGQHDLADVQFRFVPAPPNDGFADRLKLVGEHLALIATLNGSSIEALEPTNYFGQTPARTIWWTWTAPATGWVALRSSDTSKEPMQPLPILEIFEGENLSNLNRVALTPLLLETRFWPTETGRTYHIRMSDISGDFELGTNVINLRLDWSDLQIIAPVEGERFTLPAHPTLAVSGVSASASGETIEYWEQTGFGAGRSSVRLPSRTGWVWELIQRPFHFYRLVSVLAATHFSPWSSGLKVLSPIRLQSKLLSFRPTMTSQLGKSFPVERSSHYPPLPGRAVKSVNRPLVNRLRIEQCGTRGRRPQTDPSRPGYLRSRHRSTG